MQTSSIFIKKGKAFLNAFCFDVNVKPRNGSAVAPLTDNRCVSSSQRLIVSARVSCLASHVKPRNGSAVAPLQENRFVSSSQRLIVSARVSRLASNRAMAAPLRPIKKQICLIVSASYHLSSRLTSRVSRQTAQWQRRCAPPRKQIRTIFIFLSHASCLTFDIFPLKLIGCNKLCIS